MIKLSDSVKQKLEQAQIIWFTTVRADGMPQPTPVWYIIDNDAILIYSKPDAQKLRNIRNNPKVALNLDSTDEGESYLVIMGEATIIDDGPRSVDMAAYVEKYSEGIADIGYTPETLAQTWSVPIRVTPLQIREL
jgi:PPOX class probable F420-dependent enzyme